MKRPPESGEYGFVNEKGPNIKPSRDADLDWLSEADRECLDEALRADERLRKRNPKDLFGARTKASHDRAWEKAFKERGTAGSIRMNVEDIIKEELNNPEELLDYIYNRH
ncbi:MAG: hypothetical protein M5R40_16325 [Anaerolineae bacterium]|nr:hypothetical protein [Anaerolineae bacterium]